MVERSSVIPTSLRVPHNPVSFPYYYPSLRPSSSINPDVTLDNVVGPRLRSTVIPTNSAIRLQLGTGMQAAAAPPLARSRRRRRRSPPRDVILVDGSDDEYDPLGGQDAYAPRRPAVRRRLLPPRSDDDKEVEEVDMTVFPLQPSFPDVKWEHVIVDESVSSFMNGMLHCATAHCDNVPIEGYEFSCHSHILCVPCALEAAKYRLFKCPNRCVTDTPATFHAALVGDQPAATIVRRMLRCLSMRCIHGCGAVFPIGMRASGQTKHDETCPRAAVKCPWCDQLIKIDLLREHQSKDCEQRLLSCVHCRNTYHRNDETHLRLDGSFPPCTGLVPCPFRCMDPRRFRGAQLTNPRHVSELERMPDAELPAHKYGKCVLYVGDANHHIHNECPLRFIPCVVCDCVLRADKVPEHQKTTAHMAAHIAKLEQTLRDANIAFPIHQH